MYLLAKPWSLKETILFSTIPTVLSWSALLLFLDLLSRNDISAEMGIAASGFIAIGFVFFIFLLILFIGVFLDLDDTFFYFRKIVAVSFFTGLFAIPLASFFPANLLFAILFQSIYIIKKAPVWRQTPPDESIRLEPVFFAAVGIKFVIALSLFSGISF